MTFDETVAYMSTFPTRAPGVGLERMRVLARLSGFEDFLGSDGSPQYFHITGTNGKGSVTAYVQSMLHEAGLTTGAYFSPYVFSPFERIQLGMNLITEEQWIAAAQHLRSCIEDSDDPELKNVTEFDFKTAMAMQFWKDQQCNAVALEVGIGGRLDSTNIVSPASCAIVSVGLDHTQMLGPTLEAIATEKAGIIKEGRPVVLGTIPDGPRSVIEEIALDHLASVWRLGQEVRVDEAPDGSLTIMTPGSFRSNLRTSLFGPAQPGNAAIAVAMLDAARLEVSDEAVTAGLAKARLPGRFQVESWNSRQLILDGAHNPQAAEHLREAISRWTRRSGRKVPVALVGMLGGHEPRPFLEILGTVVERCHFVPIDFPKALKPSAILDAAQGCFKSAWAHESIESALLAAADSIGDDEAVLVTGSFYLVGEIGDKFLGLGPTIRSRPQSN